MKKLITISTILALILTGCASDPIANFAFSPANINTGEKISFENLSADAESFEWSFGDGNFSSAFNPVHRYMSGGTYTVQLKAFGRQGGLDVAQATITVTSVQPVADFSIYTDLPGDNGPVPYETDIVFVGEEVEFFNTSVDAADYLWQFGDGYTSEFDTPVYSYDDPGTYTVTLTAYGSGDEVSSYSKILEVVEGVNSALRITVLEYYDEYPVEGASVLLFESLADWEDEFNPSEEVFTTPLGKCVFEGLNYQGYYVDVWEADHDNYTLAAEDVAFIKTQLLEPGYIHDFIAYVDYYEPGKKAVLTRIGKKKLAAENVSQKKSAELRSAKENKFSKTR
ncbi:MAG: PKD domain-containing protein [Bacteroidales bacterium]|nr:PKD domain-containing protein [Bacteroidales bacterium]MDT8429993.1 PKD domain-containing protein [Bacteroidales bacterium]